MRAWSWVKRHIPVGSAPLQVLTLLTPEAASHKNPILRLALAGGTAAALALTAAVGVVAAAALLLAIAIMYFLSTQVLGLKIDVDPRAFYERMQQQAAAYGPN